MSKNTNELSIKNNKYISLLNNLQTLIAQDQLSPADAEIFVARIAADLPADKTLPYRILQFYRLWPKGIPTIAETSLSWTHHIELLALKDECRPRRKSGQFQHRLRPRQADVCLAA